MPFCYYDDGNLSLDPYEVGVGAYRFNLVKVLYVNNISNLDYAQQATCRSCTSPRESYVSHFNWISASLES